MQYCTRCCIPASQEGVSFDELGICTACQTSEQKMHIRWDLRRKKLESILDKAKKEATSYDCILPISGGKDSFFQAHMLTKVFGLNPLAVTFSHNWYSETGVYNLQLCLDTFNLDHVQFTPSRSKVNKLARQSLFEIGDSCWHCHAGVGSFPLKIAKAFNVKLLIWGESICESSGRGKYSENMDSYDKDYFTKVSAKKTPEQIAQSGNLTLKELEVFRLPSAKEIDDSGIWGIHLGDYIFWDEERQTEFIIDNYGWRQTDVEGAFKGYKSAECIMAGVHDYMCFEKRGFSRASMQASVDVRNGLMTRDEGMDLAASIDKEVPYALDYYLKITGLTKKEFLDEIQAKRNTRYDTDLIDGVTKERSHVEQLIPFYESLINKYRTQDDPRLSNADASTINSNEWYK